MPVVLGPGGGSEEQGRRHGTRPEPYMAEDALTAADDSGGRLLAGIGWADAITFYECRLK